MKKEKIHEILADVYQSLKSVAPMILSHHPPCDTYKNHTINIGRVKLCIGCFVGYPSAILSIFTVYFLFKNKPFNLVPVLLIGILFSFAQLLSLTPLTEKKPIKMLQKFLIGTGSGFIIIFLYISLQIPEILKLVVIFIFVSIFIIPIGYLHYRTSVKTCENCKIKDIPGKCPVDFSFSTNKP
ncbi:MAG: hypothetical protein ACTSWX_05320 [Promethearchaeota archaeon]